VALLACSVWAEVVSISQLLSSSEAGPSQATIALSAILFLGILLLVILLPVAFFRVKYQDAREQAKFRKVFALLASRTFENVTHTIQVEINLAKNLAFEKEMSGLKPSVLPDEDDPAARLRMIRASAARPDDDESGTAQQASTRARASKVDPAIAPSVLRIRASTTLGSMQIMRRTRPPGA
jgi:hypothetical protein